MRRLKYRKTNNYVIISHRDESDVEYWERRLRFLVLSDILKCFSLIKYEKCVDKPYTQTSEWGLEGVKTVERVRYEKGYHKAYTESQKEIIESIKVLLSAELRGI